MMSSNKSDSFISVIIPTYNRAELLRESLESLTTQSTSHDQYEVVVIDDGSSDNTQELCKTFETRLPIRYFYQCNSGISAAKNLGIFVSEGPLLLFFDDDDVADKNLLKEHLRSHKARPQENIAVLGYTTWHADLKISRVMDFITNIGQFLFAYQNLKHGQELDFTYFWGGRSSCKKSFLVRHGIFNQCFRFGSEDIELGYRLSKFGLKVIHNRKAISYMIRPITYDQFCQRCIKQGKSQYFFSKMHSSQQIQKYCMVDDVEEKWAFVRQSLDEKIKRAREIETLVEKTLEYNDEKQLLKELGRLYWWTFNALKIQGIIEARQTAQEAISEKDNYHEGKTILPESGQMYLNEKWSHFSPPPHQRGNILIIDPMLPMYDRASGSLRLFEIIQALIRLGYEITYIARNGEHAQRYVPILQEMGVEVYAGDPTALEKLGLTIIAPYLDVKDVLLSRKFDHAILSFWHVAEYYLPLIRMYSPETHIIIDTVDVHFMREMREAELKKDQSLLRNAQENKQREISIYGKGDRLWVVTEDDKKTIEEYVDVPVDVIPNVHKRISATKIFEETAGLLFVGNFNHKPNIDAVTYLHEQIYPSLQRSLPGKPVYIVGNNPPKEIEALNSEDFIVTGYVEDLTPYLEKARISINPLTYGAGMKGKVGEALSWGLPVVTSSIGAEGMNLEDGSHVLIADNPKEFAEKTAALYHDKDSWERLSKNGKHVVEQRWSPDSIQKRIEIAFLDSCTYDKNRVSVIMPFQAADVQLISILRELVSPFDKQLEFFGIHHTPEDNSQNIAPATDHHQNPDTRIHAIYGADYASSINKALTRCQGAIIYIMTSPELFDPQTFRAMMETEGSEQETGVVYSICSTRERQTKQGVQKGCLSGILIHSSVLQEIGGVDTRFKTEHLYWLDFIKRVSVAGYGAKMMDQDCRAADVSSDKDITDHTGSQEEYLTQKSGTPAPTEWRENDRYSDPTQVYDLFQHFMSMGIQSKQDSSSMEQEPPEPGIQTYSCDEQHPLTSIIILCFNGLEFTRQCLESINENTTEPHELVIVDNGSSDETRDYLKEFSKKNNNVKLILNEKNRGFAAGNNQALEKARGDYVVLLNNDVILTKGWLGKMISHMRKSKDIGMVGPITNSISGDQLLSKISYGNDLAGLESFADEISRKNHGRFTYCMRLVGFCLLVKRHVIEIIGGLDENFSTGNYEDDDLCIRSAIAGFKHLIARDVFVHHFGSMTFKKNALDYNATLSSNRAYFLKKWDQIVQPVSEGYTLRMGRDQQISELIRWGEQAFERNEILRALKIFERVLTMEPKNIQALNNLGVLQWNFGNADSAIETFQSVLQMRNDNMDALSNLSQAIAATGRFDLLNRDLMDTLETLHPHSPEMKSLMNSFAIQ